MRLTRALFRHSYPWLRKQIWRARGVLKITPYERPNFMKQKGIVVEDPTKWAPPVQVPEEEWIRPVPDDPRFGPQPRLEDNVDYHEQPVHDFGPKTRLLEGENQALILTKSQRLEGLPRGIQDQLGNVNIPNQDELAQRYIMQANVWDPTKQRLPKRFDKSLPGWHFKREYGIPEYRRISILLQNILRLCETLRGRSNDLTTNCRTLDRPHVSAYYYYKDNPVRIHGESAFITSSNRPLDTFATQEEIDSTVTYTLPDLFPVSPLIDLKPQHVYDSRDSTGWREGATHVHPHTLYMVNPRPWPVSMRNAKYLMLCFAHCLTHAKHLYGSDMKVLPEPISMQCVACDGQKFDFTCFQLNTLSMGSEDGIKNLVWFENDQALYERVIPRRAMLRNTMYINYDPKVLDKFVTFFANCAKMDPLHSQSDSQES